MTSLGERVHEALEEGRTLILGAEIILGLLFRSVFEPGYETLPRFSQYVIMTALAFIVGAFSLLTWPVAYHRIVEDGHDHPRLHKFLIAVTRPALPLFGMSMALTLFVATQMIAGVTAGIVAGSSLLVGGFYLRHAFGAPHPKSARHTTNKQTTEKTDLDARVSNVLTELKMVLPGAQALLGFQFITMLLEGFESQPRSAKLVHLASLLATALSVTLLLSPAAHHRIVEEGENTEEFLHFASRMLLAAMATLALGISGDFSIVVLKITTSTLLAAIGGVGVLIATYGLWFGFTLYRRFNRRGRMV